MRIRIVASLVVTLFLSSLAYGEPTSTTDVCEERLDEQQEQIDELRREIEVLKKLLVDATKGSSTVESNAEEESVGEPEAEQVPIVQKRSKKGSLSLGGRIHRVVMQVDDGASS